MNGISSKLLSRKQSKTIEVEIHLFEDCNLTCSFCCQEHNQLGKLKETVADKYNLCIKYLETKIDEWNNFSINIMGGEIFQDKLSDAWFEDYEWLMLKIKDYLKNKTVKFNLTSNLIFEDRMRVKKLLESLQKKKVSISLHTSFDFSARSWNEKQKLIFRKNLNYFEEYINSISVTLHKLSIRSMLSKRDHLFDYCYDKFNINFDWYVPDLINSKVFHPSDEECKNALIYIAKNYPDSYPMKNYLNNELNEVQCCSENRILIAANNTISSCQYLDYKQSEFVGKIDKKSSQGLADRFLESQGCLSCENFEKCGLYCYVAADFSSRKKNTINCFLKEFYSEVGLND